MPKKATKESTAKVTKEPTSKRKATQAKTEDTNPLEMFSQIGDFRNLPKEVLEAALTEALEKGYRKSQKLDDTRLRVFFDDNGHIKAYRLWDVVENPTNHDSQLDLEEAKDITPNPQIGQVLEEEIDINDFVRGDVSTVKSVMLQKIKEAEKKEVVTQYSDKVGDMVDGIIESVDDRFVVVRLGATQDGKLQPGATDAIMRKSDQIPSEEYEEGKHINVVISKVDKESKGAIVMVSRADNDMIKRLFEQNVPEIYQGIIEIKSIARDPGLRAKMAVVSKRDNIDPIGACIGQGGMRVRAISKELNGEKIDIFKWSDDLQELVRNALSPAQGVEVFLAEDAGDKLPLDRNMRRPNRKDDRRKDDRKVVVAAVPANQLSLAIGKRGQNAKLAYKLCNHRIDIHSQEELEEAGIDWRSLVAKMRQEYEEKKAQERAYKQQQRIEELKNPSTSAGLATDEMGYYDEFEFDDASTTIPKSKSSKSALASSTQAEHNESDMEEAARIAKEKRRSLTERRNQTYVSKFETIETPKVEQSTKHSKPWRSKDDWKNKDKDDRRPEKKKPSFQAMHPIYTEEELEEIENNEIEEELNASWNEDIDYAEYDSYYDDEY